MARTPGICVNTDCPVGRRHRPVMVALTDRFVCPSCGGPLSPPEVRDAPRPPVLVAGAGAAVLLLLAVVFFWHGSGKAPKPTPPPAPKAAAAAPAPVPPPPAAVPPDPSIVGSSSPAGPTTVTLVPPAPSDTQAPTPAAGPASAAPLAPTAPKIDTKPPVAVSDATMQANPPAPPTEIEPTPPRPRHKVVATSRIPTSKTAAKTPPPDEQPLDGSQPDYPAAYEDTDRTGEVTATCVIQLDGRATNCRVTHQSGGSAFAESVLTWLARDTTRFKPLLRHGKPAAGSFTWSVSFQPS